MNLRSIKYHYITMSPLSIEIATGIPLTRLVVTPYMACTGDYQFNVSAYKKYEEVPEREFFVVQDLVTRLLLISINKVLAFDNN